MAPKRTAAAAALALAALTALAGCASPTPQQAAELDPVALGGAEATAHMADLYESALTENRATIVIQGPAATASPELWDAFAQRFPGITITPQDAAPPETAAKLDSEATSGNHVIDVVATGDTPAAHLSAKGQCTSLDLATTTGLDPIWLPMDATVAAPSISIFGIVYNTDMVDESDVPTSWQDLLDEEWKGKIAIGDPAGGGIATYTFAQMLLPDNSALGAGYIERLKAQDLQIVSSEPEIVSAVGAGRYPIGILVWKGFADAVIAKGVPVEFSFPLTADNVTTADAYCLAKTAPHPEAAELLMNWLFTPEAQTVIAETGAYSTMPGAPAPSGQPPLGQVKLMAEAPLAEREQILNDLQLQVVDMFS